MPLNSITILVVNGVCSIGPSSGIQPQNPVGEGLEHLIMCLRFIIDAQILIISIFIVFSIWNS